MAFLRFSSLVATFVLSITVCAQRTIDIQHYNFEITLSDTHDTISARATITVKFLENTDAFQLDLASIRKDKGMLVYGVIEDSTGKMLSHQHKTDKLKIDLPNTIKAGNISKFTIVYRGVPADALIISKNKYGHRTFFADNWPNRGHNWLACVDDPADKASVDFIVTAPQHYQVVSNGVLIEETNLDGNRKLTHWKEEEPIATKVMVIGAADFAVQLAGVVDGCIPVYSWVYPEDRDKGFYDYAQAAEILPFFIKYIGPYGYKKLANVQSKTTFGGLENANTIFYAENSISGQRLKEDLLAHEIAHQWFGNMITEKSFAHLWLSEGFATYMTILYMENKYGKDKAVSMLEEDRTQVITFAGKNKRPVVDDTTNYMTLLNANSYQKGGWVLHMLRRQLGDTIFQKSVRAYYAAYAGKNADTRDLQKVFEEVSGKNLAKFFDQWLYTPGVPSLDIKWRYHPAAKKIELTIDQLQKDIFDFPLEIKIKIPSNKSTLKTIKIDQASLKISMSVDEKPLAIEVDPNTSLLFKATISEVK